MASLPVLRYYVLHLVPSTLFGTLQNIYAQVRGYIPVCTYMCSSAHDCGCVVNDSFLSIINTLWYTLLHRHIYFSYTYMISVAHCKGKLSMSHSLLTIQGHLYSIAHFATCIYIHKSLEDTSCAL